MPLSDSEAKARALGDYRFTAGPISIEARSNGEKFVRGYAAVYYDGTAATEFELWEGVVERIMPGAFDEPLARGDDVLGLFNHDPSEVLGRTAAGTLTLTTDEKGLRYKDSLPNTTTGRNVAVLVGRRDITGSSFGFRVVREAWEKTDDLEIRELHKVDLRDVGPVTWPAYMATTAERLIDATAEARSAYDRWVSHRRPQKTAGLTRAKAARRLEEIKRHGY